MPSNPTKTWQYESLRSGHSRTSDLSLFWELDGDPLTDDYLPEEITAAELWQQWRRRYPTDVNAERLYGPGAHRIWWFVHSDGMFEAAPFQDWRGISFEDRNFLTHFTWPADAATGEGMSWMALPVTDKVWRPGRGDKGGFIQELTGWKPSPLQAFVNVLQLERAAGLTV